MKTAKASGKKPDKRRTDAARDVQDEEWQLDVLRALMEKLPPGTAEPRTFNDLFNSVAHRIVSEPAKPLTWLKYHGRFFGVADDGSTMTKLGYLLPVGFTDWSEWEKIVVSKILALARLDGDQSLPTDCDSKARDAAIRSSWQQIYTRACIAGACENGFESGHWQSIFEFLKTNGKVSLADALSFFRRINDRRENFKSGDAQLLPPRPCRIAEQWIDFDPEPGTPAGLCVFTNASAAMIMNRQEGTMTMTEPNFSRDSKNLGLIRCRRASFKATEMSGELSVTRRT